MPLSEHEQRVLNELEQALYRHDPAFAARVKSENVYRFAGRYMRWSVLGFVVGLVVMLMLFTTSWYLGLLGVLVMFGSLLVFMTNLRRVGKAGFSDIGHSIRTEGLSNAVGEFRGRLRDRFRRDR